MSEERHTIHIRIRDLRRSKALTQEELAQALGLSRQSINAMEAGRCLPSLPVAMQIASYFSVPLHAVFRIDSRGLTESQRQQLISNQGEGKENSMSRLVPWSPLNEMREMLDEMMDTNWTPVTTVSVPAVNIHQTEKDIEVEMRLPGFKKEDISIEVGEDFLTISGEAKHEQEKQDKQYFRREFAAQSFSRTVALPAIVETDTAEAEVKQGILHISLKKLQEEKPKTRKIEIKSEK